MQFEVQQLPAALLGDLGIRSGSYRAWLAQWVQPVYVIGGGPQISVQFPHDPDAIVRGSRAFAVISISTAGGAGNISAVQVWNPAQPAGTLQRVLYVDAVRIRQEAVAREVQVCIDVSPLSFETTPPIAKNFGTPPGGGLLAGQSQMQVRLKNGDAATPGTPITFCNQLAASVVDDLVVFDPPVRCMATAGVTVRTTLANSPIRVAFQIRELDV